MLGLSAQPEFSTALAIDYASDILGRYDCAKEVKRTRQAIAGKYSPRAGIYRMTVMGAFLPRPLLEISSWWSYVRSRITGVLTWETTRCNDNTDLLTM